MKDPSKLDRLLELRRHEEQRRAVELAMARGAVADSEEALSKSQEQRREVEKAIENLSGESVGEVQTLRILVERLDQGIHNAHSVRALALATASEKEEQFAEARQRREALERVVIPRREQALALARIAEQKQEDEVALTRFRSRGRAAS